MTPLAGTELHQRFTRTWESPSGLSGWIATVNSRPLGERYMLTALGFFTVGILLALVMRSQLAVPDNTLLGPDAYNGVFTMHGSTMLYLFAVPFIEGLAIYLIPLLVGSRDLAFPRLTNFGYWLYLFGGSTMYASVLFGVVADAAWTAYPPLAGPQHSGLGLDFWLLGLSMIEIAGIGAAVEIVATILKLRAPGMAIQHLPVLAWSYLVTGLMIIFAFTPLLLATLMLEMDRAFGTCFFDPALGGSSLLWQHLFWWFGHPEVYIIFLPATGVISEIVPVLARRRLVAYPLVVAAIVTTGYVSFGLWSHHMFTTGIPELPMHFFTAASYMIALASGVQIFAWIATLWGSRPRYDVRMLYLLGFFFIFVNGGLTGVMVATMTFDWQVHETNFVVAHFHHVLIGGAVLPLLAGLHHWLPKISGRTFSTVWAKIAFGFIFVGFNTTFLPMYVIGLFGMRRRVYTYPEELGVGTLNLISTVGAYLLAAGFLTALINLAWNARRGRRAGADPWGAGSLEWSVASPPPPYGFGRPPVVRDLYPQWQRVGEPPPADRRARALEPVAAALEYRPSGWRATLLTDLTNAQPQTVQFLPGPTHLPFATAVAILVAAIGMLAQSYRLAAVALLVAAALVGRWITREPELPPEEVRLLADRPGLPVHGTGRRALAWWGMVGMLAVLFTVLGALLFSYFYLRLYSDQWPQEGLPRPGLAAGLGAMGVLVAGGVAQVLGALAWRRGAQSDARPGAGSRRVAGLEPRRALIVSLAATLLLGLAFVALAVGNHPATFAPTVNAYASIYHTVNGFAYLVVVVGIALQAGTLARVLRRGEPLAAPRLRLWLQNSELYWFFAVATAAIGLAVTQLVPHVM
ncbi:MAG: cbb3-type cytochrome c oxidase subunit I [Candidatus Krumholzibacteriia bacterium]